MSDTGQLPAVIPVAELNICKTNTKIKRLLYLESINHFLVAFSDGEVHFIDGNFDAQPFFITKFNTDFKLFYNLARGTVVAFNNDFFGYRSSYEGTYCLSTILDAIPNEQNNILRLEISPEEACNCVTLNSVLNNRREDSKIFDFVKPYVYFVKMMSIIADSYNSSTANCKDRSIVITLYLHARADNGDDLIVERLVDDLTKIVTHLSTPGNSIDGFTFTPIAIILQRIMMRLSPMHPFQNNAFAVNRDANGHVHHEICRKMLCSEAARRLTFHRWPHPEYPRAIPSLMAEAGFFHNSMTENEDRVFCFACDVCLVIWEHGDDPMTEHQRHAPNCPFVKGYNTPNIPRFVTMSHLGAIHWRTENNHSKNLIVGNMSANTDWLASSFIGKLDNCVPEIRLYNLNGIAEFFHCINVDILDIFETANASSISKCALINMKSVIVQKMLPGTEPPVNKTDCGMFANITALSTANFNDVAVKNSSFFVFAAISIDKTLRVSTNTSVPSSTFELQEEMNIERLHPFIIIYHMDEEAYKLTIMNKTSKDTMEVDSEITAELKSDETDGSSMEVCETLEDSSSTERTCVVQSSPAPTVLYDQRSLLVRNCCCIHLPSPFNSSDCTIDHLVSSDINGGFLTVGVNSQSNTGSGISGLLIYRYSNKTHLWDSSPLKFHFNCGKIEQILILPWDYFANQAISVDKDKTICSIMLRFSNGSVVLVDPNNERLFRVLENRHVIGLELSRQGAFAALSDDGKLTAFDIKIPFLLSSDDALEGKSISFISTLSNTDDFEEHLKQKLQQQSISGDLSADDLLNNLSTSIIYQSLNFSRLSDIWSLIRAKIPATSSKANTGLSPVQLKFSSSSALNSNFQIHAPLNWSNVMLSTNKMHESGRTWKFSPTTENCNSCVFQLNLMPSMPLSHVNIDLQFNRNLHECPDVTVTILRFHEGKTLQDFLEYNQNTSSGIKLNIGNDLSDYGLRFALSKSLENIKLLKEYTKIVAGPFNVKDFIVGSNSSVIQVNSSVLYKSICDNVTTGGSQWMSHCQKFCILLESISSTSAAQLIWEKFQASSAVASTSAAVKRSKSGEKMDSITYSDNGKKTPPQNFRMFLKKREANLAATKTKTTILFFPKFGALNNYNLPCLMFLHLDRSSNLFNIISFTAYNSDTNVPQNKLQRVLLLKETNMHSQLLHIAAGILPESEQVNCNNGRFIVAKNQALDILLWLLGTWKISPDRPAILSLERLMRINQKKIFYSGFINSPSRTISHKWTMFIYEFIDLLHRTDSAIFDLFLEHFLKEANDVIPLLHMFDKSSGLIWFFTVLSVTLKESVTSARRNNFMIYFRGLFDRLTDSINNIGAEWKSQWNESVHSELSQKHDLNGILLNQDFFDHPAHVMVLRSKIIDNNLPTTKQQHRAGASSQIGLKKYFTNQNMDSSSSLQMPLMFNADSMGEFGDEYPIDTAPPKKQIVFSNQYGKTDTNQFYLYMCPPTDIQYSSPYFNIYPKLSTFPPDSASTSGSGPAYVSDHYLSKMETPLFSTQNPHTSGVSTNQSDFTLENKESKIKSCTRYTSTATPLREHAVDEVTWLQLSEYKCFENGIIMKSKDTAQSKEVITRSESISNAYDSVNRKPNAARVREASKNMSRINDFITSKVIYGPEQMPGLLETESLSFTFTHVSESLSFLNDRTGETLKLHPGTKSKNERLYKTENVLEVSKRIITSNAENNSEKLANTGNSSMFQSQSFIKSHYDGGWIAPTLNQTFDFKASTNTKLENAENSLSLDNVGCNYIKDDFPLPSIEHFKSADYMLLKLEKMTTSVPKTVVIDFGDIVLLTDLLMPACEYLGKITVDGFCIEDQDVVDLISSTEVSHKCLTLNDIQLPALVRYISITYWPLRFHDSPCLIPLPQFFGTRFYTAWQAYSSANLSNLLGQLRSVIELRLNSEQYQWSKLQRLHQLADLANQRYKHSNKIVRNLVNDNASKDVLLDSYQTCVQRKLELNRIMFAIKRIEHDVEPVNMRLLDQLEIETDQYGNSKSLRSCSADQLRYTAVTAFSFAIRVLTIFNINSTDSLQYSLKSQLTTMLTLEQAVQHFKYFCCETIPQLQMQCCAWLLYAGKSLDWWSDFFPTILRNFFCFKSKKMDSVFYLLSYLCCESVVCQQLQKPIMQKLLEFLDEQLNDEGFKKTNTSLLSWTLLLISSAFDVITPIRKKRDRWNFLTGDFSTDDSLPSPTEDVGGYADKCGFMSTKPINPALLNSLVSANKKYKKISEHLQKMQPSDLTAPEMSKLKEHMKFVETIYGKLKNETEHIIASLTNDLPSSTEMNLTKSIMSLAHKSMTLAPKVNDNISSSDNMPASTDAGEFGATDDELLDLPSALGVGNVPILFPPPPAPMCFKKLPLPPPGFAENTFSSKSRHSLAVPGGSRTKINSGSRHYNIHLKLSTELCARVLSSIVKLCRKKITRLSLTTQLIAFKVISKISIHGSHNVLSLSSTFGDDLSALIAQSLIDFDNKWIRHALLQLLLDLTNAEICIHQKQVINEFSKACLSTKKSSQLNNTSSDSDLPAMSSTSVGAKRRKETEEDTEDEVSIHAPIQQHLNYMNKINDTVAAISANIIEKSSSLENASQIISDQVVDEISINDATSLAATSLIADLESESTSKSSASTSSSTSVVEKYENSILKFDISREVHARSIFLQPSDIYTISNSGASQCGALTICARTRRSQLLLYDSLIRLITREMTSPWNISLRACRNAMQPNIESAKDRSLNVSVQNSQKLAVCEIIGILHGLIQELDGKTTNPGVPERILDFYCLYHSSISGHLKISILSLGAIDSLMKFAVDYLHMDELLWSQILKIIDYSIAEEVDCGEFSCQVVELDSFQPFLECFCRDSLNKFCIFSTEPTFGPALAETFLQFFERLYKQPSSALVNKTIGTICDVLSKDTCSRFVLRHFPTDVLIEISTILASNIRKCANVCDSKQFSRLFKSLVDFIAEYIILVAKKDPRAQEGFRNTCLSEWTSLSTNNCFTSLHSVPVVDENCSHANNPSAISISALFKQNTKSSSAAAANSLDVKNLLELSRPPTDATKSLPKHLLDRREALHDSRYETIICNLLRTICVTVCEKSELCDELIQNHSSSIAICVDILSHCRSDESNIDDISVAYWEPVSVADMVLYLLLCLAQCVEMQELEAQYLHIIMKQLRYYLTGKKMSDSSPHLESMDVDNVNRMFSDSYFGLSLPLAFFLVHVINRPTAKAHLIKLNGHLLISEQIETCSQNFMNIWPTQQRASFTSMTRQLRMISSQALGKGAGSSVLENTNQLSGLSERFGRKQTMDNQWINFAPYCTATSSAMSTNSLQPLLALTASHRRSRSLWGFNYLPNQEWLDITLTLPYPIILHEIVIKPHTYSAVGTSNKLIYLFRGWQKLESVIEVPSAIQVELCSNEAWSVLSCPQIVFGLHRISIFTEMYKSVVYAIRIYLKRPVDVCSISLTQIMLLGSYTSDLDIVANNVKQERNLRLWLPIFNRLTFEEPLIWNYAPQLPGRLMELFLSHNFSKDIYDLLMQWFINIDYISKSTEKSIVNFIITYIDSGKEICVQAQSCITKLLYALCCSFSSRKILPTAVALQTTNAMAVERIRQLLGGVASIISKNTDLSTNPRLQLNIAVVMQAVACALWQNVDQADIRYETIAIALDFGSKIIKNLMQLALENNKHKMVKYAATGLLCSLVRAVPTFLSELIAICGEHAIVSCYTGCYLAQTLGRICQSSNAIRQLLNDEIIDKNLKRACVICDVLSAKDLWDKAASDIIEELISIIIYFEKLCVINIAVAHMASNGKLLFEQLFNLLINYEKQVDCNSVINKKYTHRILHQKLWTRLRRAFIKLAKRCISYDFGHRSTFAELINKQLKAGSIRSDFKKARLTSLNSEVINLFNTLVVDDEKIVVHFTDVISLNGHSRPNEDEWSHPLFGCDQNHFIVSVSLCTALKELVPLTWSNDTEKREKDFKKSSDIYISMNADDLDEDFENVTFNTELPMFSNIGQPTAFSKLSNENETPLSLYCKDYVKRLNTTWSLQQLIDIIKKVNGASPNYSCHESTLPVFSDGYFVLNLMLKNSDNNLSNDEVEANKTEARILSTLDKFALIGGFYGLSHYLSINQIYRNFRSFLNRSSAFVDSLLVSPAKRFNPLVDRLVNSINGISRRLDQLEILLKSMNMEENGETDSQTDTADAGSENCSKVKNSIDKFKTQSLFGLCTKMDTCDQLEDDGDEYLHDKSDNDEYRAGLLNFKTTAECTSQLTEKFFVSQYVIAALSVFLQLECYGELFVSDDRECAKDILRIAFDMMSTDKLSELISSLRPSNMSTKKAKTSEIFSSRIPATHTNNETTLGQSKVNSIDSKFVTDVKKFYIYPFVVLVKLLQYFSPQNVGLKRALDIRQKAVSLGVFDIILRYLSHFTRQRERLNTLRSANRQNQLHNGTAKMIDAVLEISDQIDILRQTFQSVEQEAYKGRTSLQPTSAFTISSIPPAQFQAAATSSSAVGSINHTLNPPFSVMDPTSSTSASTDYWAKGTGFGSGTTQQVWNVNEHVAKKRQEEQLISYLFKALQAAISSNFLYEENAQLHKILMNDISSPAKNENIDVKMCTNAELVLLMHRSCLCVTVQSYLMNDSVLDMSKHIDICQTVVSLVQSIVDAPALRVEAAEFPEFFVDHPINVTSAEIDVFMFVWNSAEERRSLLHQLTNLRHQIDFYLKRLSKAVKNDVKNTQKASRYSTVDVSDENEYSEMNSNDEDDLVLLSKLCQSASEKIANKINDSNNETILDEMMPSTSSWGEQRDFEKIYCDALRSLQFDSISFYQEDGQLRFPFHYGTSLTGSGTNGTLQQSRRLAKEAVTLTTSLPLASSSTVFVRTCEERLDAMKVLITGPAGTPYSNGCFEFDVYFPPEFPNVPVDIHFQTTGNRRVRFNPNLYDDGKVCLSILNTWRGRPEERWNANTSTLLQVLVSIQSLIFVKEPYFNEPGFERYRESQSGMMASRDYDANIRHQVVRWGMIDMLRNPPLPFKDVIQRHFWLKRSEICEQIKSWIAEMQNEVTNKKHNQTMKTYVHSLTALKVNLQYLEIEFNKMVLPEGLEEFGTPSKPPAVTNSAMDSIDIITTKNN